MRRLWPLPRRAVAWLAVAGMWLLFELPLIIGPDRITVTDLRPTGEVLALACLLWLGTRARLGRWFFWSLGLVTAVFLVVRIDRTVFFVLSRSEPLLYDQLFMVRHLFILVSDLFTFATAVGLALVLAGTVAAVFLMRALLRRAAVLATAEETPRVLAVAGAAWLAVIVATAVGPRDERRPWVRWTLPELVRNVDESLRIYRTVQNGIAESPYRSFDDVRLERKPDFLLFFVESYGKLLAESPDMRPLWESELEDMDHRLTNLGWHTASAYGTAPVSGGRSWLAVSSIMLGTTIQYEAVFRQFVEAGDRVPSLARFFDRQGYATVNLAPSDRPRPGVEDRNAYGYRTYLRFNDLAYVGPKMGWGLVPDQYALGYAEEHVLSRETRPLFLHFHMVSSHAPWRHVPEYVDDWRTWNDRESPPESITESELSRRLKRYTRQDVRETYLGDLTAELREGYERGVFYDFRVIEEYLSHRQKDAIVVMMGDHQPPVVAPETEGFDVPIHVFARDPKLLAELLEHGFAPGLVLPANRPATVKHAGLFSLFVRTLSRARGSGGAPLYLPNGTGLGS